MSDVLKRFKKSTSDLVDALFQEASEESQEARLKDAKERIKAKLRQLQSARLVVANIEREIEDLKLELKDTL
jgi:Sec-independent protein translocase protein TatA